MQTHFTPHSQGADIAAHSTPDPDLPPVPEPEAPPVPTTVPVPDDVPAPAHAPVIEPDMPAQPLRAAA